MANDRPTSVQLRGHPIRFDGDVWRYVDTGESVEATWRGRPCGQCGKHETPEGHDGCLGTLPGVMNACCGHGVEAEAYVQFEGGSVVRGTVAIEMMDGLRNA